MTTLYLFGHSTKPTLTTIQHALQSETPVMILSDASVQKSGQSGFAWLLAHEQTLVWQGTGLTPGPEDNPTWDVLRPMAF